ncbi:MAG: zinc-ribbon domain-containing protein [Promethearchaeati archaeon]
MKICYKCGSECSDDATFCPNCGASVKQTTSKKEFEFSIGLFFTLFCTGLICVPLFGAIFNGLAGPGAIASGIIAGILTAISFGFIYLAYDRKQVAWGALSFLLYNIIVGFFIVYINIWMGQPLNIFGSVANFFGFIGQTFLISVGLILLAGVLAILGLAYGGGV